MAEKSVLVRGRATIKCKITAAFKIMDASPDNIDSCITIIQDHLKEISGFDNKINDLVMSEINDYFDEDNIPEEYSDVLEKQSNYMLTVLNRLKTYKVQNVDSKVKSAESSVAECKVRLPELKCETFSGEGTTNLQYHHFISQFNIVGNRSNLSNATKLTYLSSYLKGYA